MKRHLNIKKFFGQSHQGIHNQVYIAIIVYCLNVLAQLRTNSKRSYLQISRYLRQLYGNQHTFGYEKSKAKVYRYEIDVSL